MWQRIQTLFLVLVALSMVASGFLPLYVQQATETEPYALFAFSVRWGAATHASYVGIFHLVSAALALATVGFYMRRDLQLQLCAVNFLVIGGTFLMTIYCVDKFFSNLPNLSGNYDIGTYCIVVAMVCNLSARFFIRKDQRRVKDADTLL